MTSSKNFKKHFLATERTKSPIFFVKKGAKASNPSLQFLAILILFFPLQKARLNLPFLLKNFKDTQTEYYVRKLIHTKSKNFRRLLQVSIVVQFAIQYLNSLLQYKTHLIIHTRLMLKKLFNHLIVEISNASDRAWHDGAILKEIKHNDIPKRNKTNNG
ncbi:hypothetical protein BpHYR1_003329 [Brachionus plicatilis]|uniref:Uncharacterized protein n=1 Tax=Brachionus plicatilis TaxID=10195 RepID=A0A3M7R9E4_BRAPC|nr:hypothetical protein BpHYR1_003329 [Brachionus plicatilis]